MLSEFHLGKYTQVVHERLVVWQADRVLTRLLQQDPTLWVNDPKVAAQTPELGDRLGWLTALSKSKEDLQQWTDFSAELFREQISRVVLLGIGGSSLAPEVMMRMFGAARGYPALTVLDTTHPQAIARVSENLVLAQTLFVVSSKSGGTLETLSLMQYFFDRVSRNLAEPGKQFVAITDPGSKLESLARARKFRRIFSSPADVGGRYAALTPVGLVPASLIGAPIKELLEGAESLFLGLQGRIDLSQNPTVHLAAVLGELSKIGCNKMTLVAPSAWQPFGVWVEQLVAESTGKSGEGILPIIDEPPLALDLYRDDRFFVVISDRAGSPEEDFALQLKERGVPLVHFRAERLSDLGGEFLRWEVAVALAAAVLRINPFDQPNVELAKQKAKEAMALPPQPAPVLVQDNLDQLTAKIGNQLGERDYIALLAFQSPSLALDQRLQQLRMRLTERYRCPVTIGYGPRYLHSTGQLHKGDGNHGIFIILLDAQSGEPVLPVPGEDYDFGAIIRAQAQGDLNALQQLRRRCHLFAW